MTAHQAAAAPAPRADTAAQSIDLAGELFEAIIDDPEGMAQHVPNGVSMILLPRDDPDYVAGAIEQGIAAVKRGEDVLFKHWPPR